MSAGSGPRIRKHQLQGGTLTSCSIMVLFQCSIGANLSWMVGREAAGIPAIADEEPHFAGNGAADGHFSRGRWSLGWEG